MSSIEQRLNYKNEKKVKYMEEMIETKKKRRMEKELS